MRRLSLFLSLFAVLVLAPIGASAQAEPFADLGLPELTSTLTDTALEGVPAETPAGRYQVTFTNNVTGTGDPFQDTWSVEFVQLPEGMTVDDLTALFTGPPEGKGGSGSPEAQAGDAAAEGSPAAGEDPFAFLYETHLAGGPGALQGETTQGVIDLIPGDYAVATFGLAATAMTVTESDTASPEAGEIESTATITETGTSGSFDFEASGLAPGPGVLEIHNDSDQPHFVFAIRSGAPITEDEVLTLLSEDEGEDGGAQASPVEGSAPPDLAPVFTTGTQSPDRKSVV